MCSYSSGDQTLDAVAGLCAGVVSCIKLISCKEDMTSFMASLSGEGVLP
jgi:hypothetical protein